MSLSCAVLSGWPDPELKWMHTGHHSPEARTVGHGRYTYLSIIIYPKVMCSQVGQIQSLNGCIQDTIVLRPEQMVLAGIPIYIVIYPYAMCSQGGQIQSLNGCIQDTIVQKPEQLGMAGMYTYLSI